MIMDKKRFIRISMVVVMLLCICAGCSMKQERKYTPEELDNLAQIEIYSAENDGLVKVIDDEDVLYQYIQCFWDGSYSEEEQEELEKSLEGTAEEYYLISYKYPVARFDKGGLEKNTTVMIYENSNVVKMTVADESIKAFSIPQEFLTFYYEVSDEDMEFYQSLIED